MQSIKQLFPRYFHVFGNHYETYDIFFQAGAMIMIGSTLFLTVLEEMYFGQMARLAIDRGAALDLSVD